jgi:hypothetical protein
MRLVEWDSLEIRVNGDRLNEMAAKFRVDPIERMTLRFSNGLLRVEGTVRKFISIPFTIEIKQIVAAGMTVRVPVSGAATFRGIPIPRFLFSLVQGRLPKDLMRFEEPATFVLSLDRFLPTFVSADIREIRIIDGGLAVKLGAGGADLDGP